MSIFADFLDECARCIPTRAQPVACGRLVRMVGLTLEAVGIKSAVGDLCFVQTHDGEYALAEVIGFNGKSTYLMPISQLSGVCPNAVVKPVQGHRKIPLGDGLLGRVINGLGEVLDGDQTLQGVTWSESRFLPINPLARAPISQPLDVGSRVINGLLTVGQGQRLGLFAGSGVGKSMLLGMLTRFTEADVIVVGLIGERGREVQEFIQHTLGADGLKKAVVVASPADDPPLLRIYGADTATAIAEYFRDQGLKVLLLMDSLTRYAQAQREVSLAVGELPATRGYTPSVFAKLPALVERAGNGKAGGGSITAIYTVLVEGDDLMDPIADAARAILDGHIVLSRKLAEQGVYPAVDIEASVSRAMPQVVDAKHLKSAQYIKRLYSTYNKHQDLIRVGAYQAGSDPELDKAIASADKIRAFISQDFDLAVSLTQAVQAMQQIEAIQAKALGSQPNPTGQALRPS